jgi:NADH dehydrogenase
MESGPPSKIHAVNVDGTAALLHACQDNDVQRFLYLSSLDVALGREDPYAETKREAESLVRASSLDWMILRPSVIYGPKGGALLNKLIRLASRGYPVPLPGNGQQLIQPLYVEDLVELIAQLLSNGFGRRVFEVGGPRASSYIEIVELAANLQGKALYTIPLPVQALAPGLLLLGAIWPGTPISWSKLKAVLDSKVLDVLPAKNDLGFVPRELIEGLRKMLDCQESS